MSKAKWLMKQYWRVGTIRVLAGLAMGMFVLGRLYYTYIPFLANWGLLGALTLGSFLFLLFLSIGWIYDEKGKMWSPKIQAGIERDPYQYVTNFRTAAIDYPVFYAVVHSLRSISEKIGIETEALDDLVYHMKEYFSSAENKKGIEKGKSIGKSFMESHPFDDALVESEKMSSLGSRTKLTFETNLLRMTWIQSLTGMAQDVLVFGALFVTLLFPEQVVNNIVPIEFLLIGILVLSLPLFFALTLLGWYYDKQLKMWGPDFIVKIERTPYTYLAQPREYMIALPFFAVFFRLLNNIYKELGIDTTELQNVMEYLQTYSRLEVSDDRNMARARKLRSDHGAIFEIKSEVK
jgi:hypothetical protein